MAAELTERTLELHEAAQAEGPTQGKIAAEDALATAKKAVRDSTVAIRSQVVHLVSLASQHFPELKKHPEVQEFTGSDGLRAYDQRQRADYDSVNVGGTNVLQSHGRHELTRWKFEGSEVCLKKFIVQGDMKEYMKEVRNVQRLRHP